MLPSRDPQRELLGFTNSESFGLFVEGLRALQCYGSESDRDQPDKTRLGWFIGQAVARLRENVKRYPDDLLPRYYLGVATTTLNQHFYEDRRGTKRQTDRPGPGLCLFRKPGTGEERRTKNASAPGR